MKCFTDSECCDECDRKGHARNHAPAATAHEFSEDIDRIASPGKTVVHGALSQYAPRNASAIIVPHSGVGGCAPKPRKPSAAVSRVAVAMLSVPCTISGVKALGTR